jgi:hypothetical protein
MREKTYRIKTNNQELLIRKQNRKVVLRYGKLQETSRIQDLTLRKQETKK